MTEIADRYRRRADAFERKLAAVRADQWSNQSPCAAWTARDVVDHIVGMHGHMLLPLGREAPEGPSVEEDPLGAFTAVRSAVESVLADPVLAATECDTPAGRMTVEQQIDQVASDDLPMHGWDLARATGQDDTIDPDDVERLWSATSAIPAETMDKYRTPGAFGPGVEVFGPEVEVPADAPLQDRLLGLIGRDPHWAVLSPKPARPSRVLSSGLAYVESPRWHEGRLWFAHWGAEEIVAMDLDGNREVVAHGRPRLGWSIAWLPDGRLLVTGRDLMRREPDGSMVRHCDLGTVADHGWNEIVVDGRGNIYLDGAGFDFLGGEAPKPGIIALVTPDGSARQVADGIEFPNGMVVTPDNSTLIVAESFAGRLSAFDIADDGSLSNRRVWAEGIGPDGICLDAEGAIWTSTGGRDCVRVREGGEVLDRIELDRNCFACMLGGPDRRTLFILAAEWRGTEHVDAALASRTGQVIVADAPAPGVGWP